MSVPAKNIESMNVLMTVVGGNIVYQREDFIGECDDAW